MILNKENIQLFFDLFSRKELDEIMKLFDENSVFVDANYPGGKLIGKKNILRGFKWSLKNATKLKFNILNCFVNNNLAFVEVFAEHELKFNLKYSFKEVFVIELENEKIKRLEAYLLSPPKNITSFISKLTNIFWKFQK